jgi:hypothetical protein
LSFPSTGKLPNQFLSHLVARMRRTVNNLKLAGTALNGGETSMSKVDQRVSMPSPGGRNQSAKVSVSHIGGSKHDDSIDVLAWCGGLPAKFRDSKCVTQTCIVGAPARNVTINSATMRGCPRGRCTPLVSVDFVLGKHMPKPPVFLGHAVDKVLSNAR